MKCVKCRSHKSGNTFLLISIFIFHITSFRLVISTSFHISCSFQWNEQCSFGWTFLTEMSCFFFNNIVMWASKLSFVDFKWERGKAILISNLLGNLWKNIEHYVDPTRSRTHAYKACGLSVNRLDHSATNTFFCFSSGFIWIKRHYAMWRWKLNDIRNARLIFISKIWHFSAHFTEMGLLITITHFLITKAEMGLNKACS